MNEVLQEAIALHNLPATVLLGLVLGYWLLVMLGALDSDVDTVDIGGHGDVHVDAEVHADVHAGADAHGAAHGEGTLGALFLRAGRFLHLGQVPFMVVLSILAIFIWFFSITGNYYLNGTSGHRSHLLALLLLVPNVFLSALLTRVAVSPFRRLFEAMQKTEAESETVVGREGRVVSSRVDASYGQVEIQTHAAPLLINARTGAGQAALLKGTSVLVFAYAENQAVYLVRPVVTDA